MKKLIIKIKSHIIRWDCLYAYLTGCLLSTILTSLIWLLFI